MFLSSPPREGDKERSNLAASLVLFLSSPPREGDNSSVMLSHKLHSFYPVPRVRGTGVPIPDVITKRFLSSPPREGDKERKGPGEQAEVSIQSPA